MVIAIIISRRPILAVLLLSVKICLGFGNFPPIADLISKAINRDQKEEDRGLAKLKELGLDQPRPSDSLALPKLLVASMPTLFRLGSGCFADGYSISLVTRRSSEYTGFAFQNWQVAESCSPGRTKQVEPIVIYEFETCPFCRKVREAVSILGLTVTYRPCPKKGRIYRLDIKQRYGVQATFPYMEDPNTGVSLFESDLILNYLFKTYGRGDIPWTLRQGNSWVALSAALGLVWGPGGVFKNSNPPEEIPLKLWSYEGSPSCKLVRQVLCELEIQHTQISCPRGSPNRQRMLDEKGRFEVPYIEDPNTSVKLWGAEAIVQYLQRLYGVVDSPVKYL
jgi:glutathione S-transferase